MVCFLIVPRSWGERKWEIVLGRAETKLLAIIFVSNKTKKWFLECWNGSICCIISRILSKLIKKNRHNLHYLYFAKVTVILWLTWLGLFQLQILAIFTNVITYRHVCASAEDTFSATRWAIVTVEEWCLFGCRSAARGLLTCTSHFAAPEPICPNHRVFLEALVGELQEGPGSQSTAHNTPGTTELTCSAAERRFPNPLRQNR